MSSGVTQQTWERLVVDAGVVYANYGETDERILGATNGGATFGWQEYNTRQPEIDGVKGPIRGTTRITRAVPMVGVNLVEWSLENLKLALPGCDEAVTGTGAAQVTTLTRTSRMIPDEAYLDNIAIVATLSGTDQPIVIIVKNALIIDGISLPTEQDSEMTVELQFVGHYSSDNPEEEPWEIRYPTPA